METKVSNLTNLLVRRRSVLARLGLAAGDAPLRVFCSGIGGTGLSGLARLVSDLGHDVWGSDRTPSPLSQSLEGSGIRVLYSQEATNIRDVDIFVATAALPHDHPELVAAKTLGVPVVKYAEALGALVAERAGVALAGTHGKTTTTSMLATILRGAGRDPSWIVGGRPRDLPCSAAIGSDPEFVFEACEFDRSFRNYSPNVAVILNVEADHLDCYPGGLDEIVEAFTSFGVQLPEGGTLIVSADWPAAIRVAERVQTARPDIRVDTFSLEGAGRVCATKIQVERGLPTFHVVIGGKDVGQVKLAVPGRHNVANALAAITAAIRVGVSPREAADAASRFTGVRRRFDVVAEGDVTIVTDYAHHPTAIEAVIGAARERYPDRRLVVCFEPHQASRTREFFDEFTESLSGADRVLLSDIYVCRDRDEDVRSVSSEDLALAIRTAAPKTEAQHAGNLEALGQVALDVIGPGDVGLFLGAGKIAAVATEVAEHCVTHPTHPAGNAAVVAEAEITGPPVLLLRDRLEHVLGGDLGRRIERDVPLGPYCTFKAGGRARFFAQPTSEDEAIRIVRTLQRRGVPFVPLGGGSNMLFTQDLFDGAVILTRKVRGSRVLGTTIRAAAGASLPGLIRRAERNGLAGLERFAGIPGTVGGAVFGNAGGPPGTATVGGLVLRARVLEADGRVTWRTGEELGLRYRASELKGCLILAVDLGLKPGCPEKLRRVRLEMSARKSRVQPLEARSAGCTFRNPDGQSAGRLIDELGLKGLSVGGAQVSLVHGNFLVNQGGASARDILGLMDLVRQRVFEAHGICLHPELRLVA